MESIESGQAQAMDPRRMDDITAILERWREGDSAAFEVLLPLVYDELRGLAGHYLGKERRDHTLEPTALVHEAYLRLAKVTTLEAHDRSHFFAVAARMMRRILVDHARLQVAKKRVGAHQKLPLDEARLLSQEGPEQLLEVHEALSKLEARHPRAARQVELRYFAGLTEGEAAEALGLSRTTTTRDWRLARVWLFKHLKGTHRDSPSA